ncbi:hypothetical protein DENSPDRAFT_842545 [Dentipellis sp. KUC8613]|nr:hypothetical protein DENSPDRAFT_842545 [Dentipellis sp. KUC8613]
MALSDILIFAPYPQITPIPGSPPPHPCDAPPGSHPAPAQRVCVPIHLPLSRLRPTPRLSRIPMPPAHDTPGDAHLLLTKVHRALRTGPIRQSRV